jgi:putative flippase GtrA
VKIHQPKPKKPQAPNAFSFQDQLIRFILVGGVSVVLDLVSYSVLLKIGRIDPVWAKRASFGIGSIWAFFANKYCTFAVREMRLSDPFLFVIVYSFGFFLNAFTHDMFLGIFGLKSVAFFSATSVSMCSNFLGQKFIVFRRKESKQR